MVNPHQKVKAINYIEEETSRQAAFAKRRNGLIKKAFEISMLCDVDVAFIAFSPTGCVNHFSCPYKRIEDVLIRFINLPSHMRQYPIENKEYLVQILNHLKQESEEAIHTNQQLFDIFADSDIHASRFSKIQEEINRVKEQIQRANTRLRNYQPDPETGFSRYEAEARKRLLENTLSRLMERKSELVVDTNTSSSEESFKEPEQLELEATAKDEELVDAFTDAKDGGDSSPLKDPSADQVDPLTDAKDGGDSSPLKDPSADQVDSLTDAKDGGDSSLLKDPSTDQVNEDPQNESTIVKDSSQNEPITDKDPSQNKPSTEEDPDNPVETEPALVPYKPQAIKFNELLDQGKELKFAQTLQEVAPSCSRPTTIINSTITKTESVELPAPDSILPQATEKLDTSSTDSPPQNTPMPELDPQDDALPSSEPVKDEEEEEEEEHDSSSATVIEHSPDEDAIQSEPRRTSSPSFYMSSFEQDTEIPGEETHGNVVPTMGLDNNDVYLNNNDDYNVPVTNMPRSSGFRMGSSSQHQTNNPPSPMTVPPGFGTRDEGPSSLNPIVDQNFTQPEPDFIHSNRIPPPATDRNRYFPLGATFHNFMQTESTMTPRPPGHHHHHHHHHQFMQLLNHAAGSAVRPHWHMGVNMPMQPQFGMLIPNHLSANGAAPFHHSQVLMGNNNGSLLQNHYRASSSSYYRRTNMEPAMGHNPIEGSSNGRGKRKFNWGNGADPDEVNSFPSQQVQNTTQEQQPINLFGPMNAFRSDAPSVYDPLYEGLGLPIDPHLRIFLASMESGKPWGKQ